jgi:hypothetical protein
MPCCNPDLLQGSTAAFFLDRQGDRPLFEEDDPLARGISDIHAPGDRSRFIDGPGMGIA